MAKQTNAKLERVVEAVRQGLEGDAAIEFIHQSGFAMTPAGIARHLRRMGGRGRIQELIDEGLTNVKILRTCLPEADLSQIGCRPAPNNNFKLLKYEHAWVQCWPHAPPALAGIGASRSTPAAASRCS